MENSSLESFLWIRISFATISFSGNIPVASDTLKMIERCSDILSLSSLRVFEVMLFCLTDCLDLRFEIISIISSFVQGEMKNESWLVREWKILKKCFIWKWHFRLNSWRYRSKETGEKSWIWFFSRYFLCYWFCLWNNCHSNFYFPSGELRPYFCNFYYHYVASP